jgi:hypothetical protein
MHNGTLKAEFVVKRQGIRTITIARIYKPDAVAVLKILARLLAEPLKEKQGEASDQSPAGILPARKQEEPQ